MVTISTIAYVHYPLNFAKEHKSILAHCKEILEHKNGYVAIIPMHSKLITALETAVEEGDVHWIVMVSTPNAPEGLFEKIERESENACLYKQLFLDHTYDIDRIYSREGGA